MGDHLSSSDNGSMFWPRFSADDHVIERHLQFVLPPSFTNANHGGGGGGGGGGGMELWGGGENQQLQGNGAKGSTTSKLLRGTFEVRGLIHGVSH